MDPRTGAILALANWPQANPNNPPPRRADALAGSRGRLRLRTGLDVQGRDGLRRAAAGPDHAGDALQHPRPDPASPTARSTTTPNTPKKRSRTSQILARSSNVGAIKIGTLEGASDFNGWVHRFGFGAPTGVDLSGEETGVTLPLSHYSGSSMGNLPIGQGELVTPMQMATAYAAIANGGILRPPHIDRRGRRQGAAAAGRAPHHLERDRRVAAAHARRRARARAAPPARSRSPATSSRARRAPPARSTRATGEYSKSAYVASFIGFAPAVRSQAAGSRGRRRTAEPARSSAAPLPRRPSARS